MEKVKKWIFLIVFIPVLSLFPQVGIPHLNLTELDLSSLTDLDGEWLFQEQGSPMQSHGTVPGSWEILTGTPYTRGTYTKTFSPPQAYAGTMGALLLPELSQAASIRMNGRTIYSSGDLSSGLTDFTISVIPFLFETENTIEIELHNRYFRSGGLTESIRIGSYSAIHKIETRKIIFESVFAGILLLAAIYHLFLYLHKYTNKSALFLTFTALFMILRAVTTGQNMISTILPAIPWKMDYRLEYLAAILSGASLLLFFNYLYPPSRRFRKGLVISALGVSGIYSVFVLLLPIRILSRTIIVLNTNIIFLILVIFLLLIRACKRRLPGAVTFTYTGVLAFALTLLDIIYYWGGPNRFFNLGQGSIIILIFTQTFVLSKLYGESFLQNKKLLIMATVDSLTGIANRQKIDHDLNKAYHAYQRYDTPFSLIMFDIDYFKKVNDSYGHDRGDKVLKELADLVQSHIRQSDTLARWGGEEFLILLPYISRSDASSAAEKIRMAVEEHQFPLPGKLTASFSVVAPLNKTESLEQLFKRMDEKLYTAKHLGRNQVVS